MTNKPLLMGIDGGQTATKSIIVRCDGTVLGYGRGGPSDHFHIAGGVEKNRHAIQGAIASVLETTGITSEQIVAVGLGLTGATTGGDQTAIVDQIVREVLTPNHVAVAHDVVTNLAGASGGQPGVVLIAGGGAIAYGQTLDGREAKAGGYGFLVGDEGSAFNIGLLAVRAATKSSDFRAAPTALEAIVKQQFGISAIQEIPRVVYQEGFSRERFSLLAPDVAQAARDGDEAALEIITTAGHELALTTLGAIRQLFQPGETVEVYLTGGVFAAGEIILAPYRTTLEQHWPHTVLREPRFPPVIGAVILAARAANCSVDASWLNQVENTLVSTPM